MSGLHTLYDRTMTSPAQEITKEKQALEERIEELETAMQRAAALIDNEDRHPRNETEVEVLATLVEALEDGNDD